MQTQRAGCLSSMPDELTSTVLDALSALPQLNKATLLLDAALRLIEAGKYVVPYSWRRVLVDGD